jgi:hypothetical protein
MTAERGLYSDEHLLYLKHEKFGMYGQARTHDTAWRYHDDRLPVYQVTSMGCALHVVSHYNKVDFANMHYQISGHPSVIDTREFNVDEIPGFFTPVKPQVREIIVEPQSVQECFDLIKKLQAPDLARIREHNRRREPVIQAQILTFG